MRPIARFGCAVLGAALVAALPAGAQDHMQDHGHGATKGIEVAHGWARATPGAARTGAAYVTVHNTGDAEDRLVRAETPVAERAEFHTHVMDGTVMRMREVEGGIVLSPGEKVVFEPGGYHIMLTGLKKPLQKGETFPLTLIFEKSGRKTVEIAVRGIGAMAPKTEHGHGRH